jgi:hypothetical protein
LDGGRRGSNPEYGGSANVRPPISEQEYRSLSDQKAADYRAILQLNPGLLAVTGAIFAAGVSQKSTIAVVLAAAPLLLAVFQLVRNAELQLQMTTYLAVFGPGTGGTWERDIAAVRQRYWDRDTGRASRIRRASGWNVWIVAGLMVSETIFAFPWLSGLPDGPLALVIATILLILPAKYLLNTSERIEAQRKVWTELWEAYRKEPTGP